MPCLLLFLLALPVIAPAAERIVRVRVHASSDPQAILTVLGENPDAAPTVDLAQTHTYGSLNPASAYSIDLRVCPVYDVLLVDVRTQEEYDEGHYEGAILIPYQEIVPQIYRYTTRRDQNIELYCASGNRAGRALESLVVAGFTAVTNGGGYAPSGNG